MKVSFISPPVIVFMLFVLFFKAVRDDTDILIYIISVSVAAPIPHCRWGGSALISLWGNFLRSLLRELFNELWRGETAAQQSQLSNSQTSSCFWTSCSHNAVTDVVSWHTWFPPVAPPELETSCFCRHGSTRAGRQEEEVFAYVVIASPCCTFTLWHWTDNLTGLL